MPLEKYVLNVQYININPDKPLLYGEWSKQENAGQAVKSS